MPTIVISRRIIITDTVQPVLHGMVTDFLPAQIIAYRIGVAEHVNIPILPEIHGDICLLRRSQLFAENHPRKHVKDDVSPVLMVLRKAGNPALLLLLKGENLAEQAARRKPCGQISEFAGHGAKHHVRPPAFFLRKIEFLQACHIDMIKGMADINPGSHSVFSSAPFSHRSWYISCRSFRGLIFLFSPSS